MEEQLTNVIGIRLNDVFSQPKPLASFIPINIDGMNMLGLLKTENTLIVFCFTFIVSFILRKYKEKHVLIIGLFLYFIGYTIISFSINPIILMSAMLFASFGELILIPIKQTILANIVPDHARGTYMGIYTLFTFIGVSTAGIFLILSPWMPLIALPIVFSFMAILTVILFNYVLSQSGKNQNQRTKEERKKLSI
ncbi:MFS transporter [Bacillus carboniphilus]|uniref:MFS transporter n=1 Tax=Bacillus carboniphilus TaxID=86663 RepID=A0ABY9JPQ6_9BACI|nr:MFS transporter [Bacillus carboniphilus]WLR41389.1 MFS transporter [Bacillus carboniphilus]